MFFRRWSKSGGGRGRRPAPRKAHRCHRIESLETRTLFAAADIVAENLLPGSPESEWGIVGVGSGNIQGFAAQMSVDQGETVEFKINTDTADYRLDIYRMGWYGGLGARRVDRINPLSDNPVIQPNYLFDPETNLVDAGNWAVTAAWDVPEDAVSGTYIAKLVREDGVFGESHIIFVVRDDDGGSDILFQMSDTTWQAYNNWGGYSLYYPNYPNGRARAVSYNRPFLSREVNYADYYFGVEYAMTRFLERNGYDVSYTTGIDTARRGEELFEHEVFISVGHDEYWSGEQRANVEAARDAGVHLAFFSGNEVYWKSRWESSIDQSQTEFRTMVTYKETVDGAPTDPSDEWTGTWRDPRFQCCGLGGCLGCPGPSGGGKPENALTGTIFTANQIKSNEVNFATNMTVSSDYSALRFWRDTEIAELQQGQTLAVGDYVLGYEFDEDLDNGFRPAGLVPLSSTTLAIAQKLQDYGATFGPGVVTHAMTMYRAASGAIVFGAGTVQYAWGLDDGHDGQEAATDRNLQQATINLFADMGVQPTTLMAGLVPAVASTDAIAPVSTITSPIAGSVLNPNNSVTITGTAQDQGGGAVAVVEISVNGGQSWHRATGTTNWSYSFTPRSTGEFTILTRAVDDSLNMESDGPQLTVNPSQTPGTYQLWPSGGQPSIVDSGEGDAIELGVKFTSSVDGYVTGVRFYKSAANTGTHVGNLWSVTGELLARATFTNESGSGWQQVDFDVPVAITAGTTYVASYFAPNGHFSVDRNFFTQHGVTDGPLHAPRTGALGSNGLFAYSNSTAFPDTTYQSSNYWVDVVLSTNVEPDTAAPTVASVTPASNAADVLTAAAPRITFSEPMNAATITAANVRLLAGGVPVAANVSYNSNTRTATITPTAALTNSTTYTISADNVTDLAGNPLAVPFSSDFTTAAQTAVAESLWNNNTSPSVVSVNEPDALELGVRFTSTTDGYISGIRFYKSAGNTGTHIANLWTASGQLLATTTFTSETASGWQEVEFDSPVAITAGTTYVASYFAPNGNFSVDRGYFNTAYTNGPLRVAAGGGVFRYGNSSGFPNQSFNNSNYWVDVVMVSTPPVDNTAPTVTSITPANGATDASVGTAPQITFNEAIDVATINTDNIRLSEGGTTVAASVSYNANTRTATIAPAAPLESSATYTVSVVAGGVADVAGNTLAQAVTSTFTTESPAPSTTEAESLWNDNTSPSVVSVNEPDALELGVRFTSTTEGYISGIRFYKSAGNTGTHIANLWTASGQLLATTTFTSETASGWQEVEFDSPVAITAGTTYVASYFAPNGNFSVDRGYFNTAYTNGPLRVAAGGGVFRYGNSSGFPNQSFNNSNYWVDVVMVSTPPVDNTAPTVTTITPANGALDVSTTVTPQIVFSEPLDAATVTIDNIQLQSGGTLVQASVSYNANTRTASLTPSAALNNSTTYTIAVLSGGVQDQAGNTLAQTVTAQFNTAAAPPVDSTPPSVTSVTPGNNAGDVSTATAPRVTFSEPVNATTVTAANVRLLSGGTAVAASVSYNSTTRVATITPNAPLVNSASYTVSVSGVADLAGNTMTQTFASNFTTEVATPTTQEQVSLWDDNTTPSVVSVNESDALELGVRFTSTTDGYISGIRFYKSAGNTGTHIANLWTASGQLLATTTFTSETASGWQEVEFDSPVAITAGTTYVASYFAPNGNFSVDRGYFNTAYTNGPLRVAAGGGVFRYGNSSGFPNQSFNNSNYWVDVVMVSTPPVDNTAPTVTTITPANGAVGTSTAVTPRVTFSESVSTATVTSSNLRLLDGPTQVTASVSYNTNTRTATITPSSPLENSKTYTVVVSGVMDLAGNPLAQDATSSFTTAAPSIATTSLWNNNTTPAIVDVGESDALELGVRFSANTDGYITGIRYYKSGANTGTHTGNLWSSSGQLLATATFTNESSSGWQEVRFDSPVPIAAGETYVASYFAPNGHFSVNRDYFGQSLTSGPLTVSTSGGVFAYGNASSFPSQSYDNSNYWVDVLFATSLI